MKPIQRAKALVRLLTWSLILTSLSVWACSVPVFRYALEHWAADPYEVIVLHRGDLFGAEQKLLPTADGTISEHANVSLKTADLARRPKQEMLDLWREVGSPEIPWLVVRTPRTARHHGVVWSGAFTKEAVAAAFDSPARRTIAERLGTGESAVWILLDSGDKAKDDAAAALLQKRLDYLGTVMELPKLDEQDIRNGLVSLPEDGLRLSFSVLRLTRNDPAEQVFMQMLLSTEADLKDQQEPIAFPIFGQARALYALVGKGIRHETIDEAASFLIGSCSCQVKEQNPGADLLMSVDWKGLIKAQSVGAQDLPTVSEIVGGMPEAVTISARPEAEVDSAATCCWIEAQTMKRILPTGLIAVFAVVVVAWLALRKRNGSKGNEVKPLDDA